MCQENWSLLSIGSLTTQSVIELLLRDILRTLHDIRIAFRHTITQKFCVSVIHRKSDMMVVMDQATIGA